LQPPGTRRVWNDLDVRAGLRGAQGLDVGAATITGNTPAGTGF